MAELLYGWRAFSTNRMANRTILFVCHYNSARSQLAEALARPLLPRGCRVLSAGLTKTVVNAEVLRSLAEIGLDASGQRSKTLGELAAEPVDEAIVLCPEALDETARLFPGARVTPWLVDDPVALADASRIPDAVRETRDWLDRRLRAWAREER